MNTTPLLLGLALAFYGCEGKSPTEPAAVVPTATVQATPTPAAMVTMTGSIIDATTGQPVTGATMSMWRGTFPMFTMVVDVPVGTFRIYIPADTWVVRVRAPGYRELPATILVSQASSSFVFRMAR